MASIFCPDCGAKATYTLNKPKFCQSCGIQFGKVSTASTATHEPETQEEENIPSLDKLYAQLRKVRKDGYSINEAETFNYVYGVGAPILDRQQRAIAAISLSGTKSTINVKNTPKLAERTILTATLIANEISKG